MLRRGAALLLALFLAAACTGSEGARTGGDSARADTPRVDTPAPPDGATAPPAAASAARGRWTVPCLRVTEHTDVTPRDTVCFRDARAFDFAGDGRPFAVEVEGRGPRADSLRVELRVTRGDTVFYRDDWGTALYGVYDARRVGADSARRRAEHHLGRLLADSAFRPTVAFLGGASDRDRTLRETIAFDLRVAAERRRRGLPPGAELPAAAAQSPRPSADTARAAALAAELRDRPAFRYYAGGEASYAVAWSPSERRFVVVLSCC
jgi:hypothetical protein